MYLSPFRSGTAPSFKVDYNKNLWYDFGSGEGGSIIDLVMKLDGCSVSDAIAKRADQAGYVAAKYESETLAKEIDNVLISIEHDG